MTLFIVSQDHEVVEQVRATLLEIDAAFAVNAVGSAEALRLRLQDDSEGHVVLVDLHINDGLGLDLAREISMSWPLVATLLLTTERGNQIYESALEVGARDVLPPPGISGGLLDKGPCGGGLDAGCPPSCRRCCCRTTASDRAGCRCCGSKRGSGYLTAGTPVSA